MKILVSDCLLGSNCKYDGGNNKNQKIIDLGLKHTLIPICPECFGGLTTPREPSERVGNKVLSSTGKDVTQNFLNGAELSLQIALKNGCKLAILKANSPSCGTGTIYDGTFTHTKIDGYGVTAEILVKNGITVCCENDFERYLKDE